MLFQVESTRSMEEIQKELEASAARHKFGVIAVHNLPEIMSRKDVHVDFDCRVYEICNPFQAKKVLEAAPAFSAALPCRISIIGKPGAYTLVTMLPSAMADAVNAPAIAEVAREVETVMLAMMKDAAG